MKVLGIDPGTAVLGYGVVESLAGGSARLLECGILATKARDPLPSRLRTIHDGIRALLLRHRPDAMAVESVFVARNVRTAMVMSHGRGVVLLAGEEAGVPITEYTPAMVKKAVVGRGAAMKPQVGYMVAQLLRLRSAPEPADAADGVAIALTHLLLAASRARQARAVLGVR